MAVFRFGAALSNAVAREALRQAAADDPSFELTVASSTATSVVTRSRKQPLDALVVDVTTPGAEDAIRDLLKARSKTKLIVTSPDQARTARDLGLRLNQVIDGTNTDYVIATVVDRISEWAGPSRPARSAVAAPPSKKQAAAGYKKREIVVLGCSTGGPEALAIVLQKLPKSFPVPIIIVQHMPPDFTRLLAERLDKTTELVVREVTGPTTARAGEVWIAPGHRHVKLTGPAGQIDLDDGPEENNCKPAVDVLFRSAAETYGRRAVGVVLTGMGDDGCRGGKLLAATGAYMIAQDEASSVVWGMPGAVTKAGLVDAVLPLTDLAEGIQQQFRVPVGA